MVSHSKMIILYDLSVLVIFPLITNILLFIIRQIDYEKNNIILFHVQIPMET